MVRSFSGASRRKLRCVFLEPLRLEIGLVIFHAAYCLVHMRQKLESEHAEYLTSKNEPMAPVCEKIHHVAVQSDKYITKPANRPKVEITAALEITRMVIQRISWKLLENATPNPTGEHGLELVIIHVQKVQIIVLFDELRIISRAHLPLSSTNVVVRLNINVLMP